MKRIDALKKIIDGNNDMFFVSINGAAMPGADLIRIYDVLNEDITIGDTPKQQSSMGDILLCNEKKDAPKNITGESHVVLYADKKDEPEEKKPLRNRNIDKGKVIALYDAGWKAKDIADECKCAIATVYKIMSERCNG